jgi:hypothetical protein
MCPFWKTRVSGQPIVDFAMTIRPSKEVETNVELLKVDMQQKAKKVCKNNTNNKYWRTLELFFRHCERKGYPDTVCTIDKVREYVLAVRNSPRSMGYETEDFTQSLLELIVGALNYWRKHTRNILGQ